MNICTGSIVAYKENVYEKYVIVKTINREEYGDCYYDRTYWIAPLDVVNNGLIKKENLIEVEVCDIHFPFVNVGKGVLLNVREETRYEITGDCSKYISKNTDPDIITADEARKLSKENMDKSLKDFIYDTYKIIRETAMEGNKRSISVKCSSIVRSELIAKELSSNGFKVSYSNTLDSIKIEW